MATYRGDELPRPDRLDDDLKLVGQRMGGMENVEEELNLPPSAEPDYVPRPGQKGYMDTQPMAGDAWDRPPEEQGRITMNPAERRLLRETQIARQQLPNPPPKPPVGTIGELRTPNSVFLKNPAPPTPVQFDKGGPVQTRDPMPPDQRKLADRINVNELMQMQDDAKYPGWGTTRETMPPPPTSIPGFANGGMVKHGSSTHVTCKLKG